VIFRQAEKIIRGNGTPVLRNVKVTGGNERVKDTYELKGTVFEIRAGSRTIRANGGLLYVLAADADTADGAIPTLALVDELHRHRNDELYGVLSDGLGPRKGRMVTISTAGAKQDSPLGRLRERAHTYPNRKVDDRHTRYQSGSFVLHEWALTDADDVEDLSDVKKANPARTQTRQELARRNAECPSQAGQHPGPGNQAHDRHEPEHDDQTH
jgi:phage terminase large subunit-like protein